MLGFEPSKALGPFHGAMKNPKNNDGIPLIDIRDYIWQSADNQFARTFHAAGSSHAGMLRECFDVPNDLQYSVDRCLGVVPADVSLDRFEILASGARPL